MANNVTQLRQPLEGEASGPTEEHTAAFDAVDCLDESVRRSSRVQSGGSELAHIAVLGAELTVNIPLDGKAVRIGRGISAELRLGDKSVSRRHAILIPWGQGHRILDDRSVNGTFVNGERIDQRDLASGDLITLGRVELLYIGRVLDGDEPAAGAGRRSPGRMPRAGVCAEI